MKRKNIVFIFVLLTSALLAQRHIDDLHGDQEYWLNGIMDGNQLRTTVHNDGMAGSRYNGRHPSQIQFEWPKNTNKHNIVSVILMPMAEVVDNYGNKLQIVSEAMGTRHSLSHGNAAKRGDIEEGTDRWQTMCALPGFVSPEFEAIGRSLEYKSYPALSDKPRSWPNMWPDKMDDTEDQGWAGSWNGYFGKGKTSADLETYYVADDYQNDEFKGKETVDFVPDTTEPDRAGLGFRLYVRGLQWNNSLIDDVIFFIHDVENIGTYNHDKVNFSWQMADLLGGTGSAWCSNPDVFWIYLRNEDMCYIYDEGDLGCHYNEIPRVGYALLETPGNEFDGIDNDGDGATGSGKTLTEVDFAPKTLDWNTQIVLTNYGSHGPTYPNHGRELTTLRQIKDGAGPSWFKGAFDGDTLEFSFIGRPKKYWAGMQIEEITFNNFDDNLNGLIDENNGSTIEIDTTNSITWYLYEGRKAIDFFTGQGLDNPMLDESRKDGIDNDNDWITNYTGGNIVDVGVDGKAETGDEGEEDGMPTSKYQTGITYDGPGEPFIDATDIDESDMLGMTAFGGDGGDYREYPYWDDQKMWNAVIPGRLVESGVSLPGYLIQVFFGSGYFAMPPEQVERISGAVMAEYNDAALLRNKTNANTAYNLNYQFAKAPARPTLTAVAGDQKVTLYWDSKAEDSYDPIFGYDFEGYRIYRSRDAAFSEMTPITNAYGGQTFMVPLAQYDLIDGITGLSQGTTEGVQFYQGDDTGLIHSWTDTTVTNGQRYFYLITSYDQGVDSLAISPTECNYSLNVDFITGEVNEYSENIAVVTPNAPSAGFIAGNIDFSHDSGLSESQVSIQPVVPADVKDNNDYKLVFYDTDDDDDSPTVLKTTHFSLINTTSGDTLVNRYDITDLLVLEDFEIIEGLQIGLVNTPNVMLDTNATYWNSGDVYSRLTFDAMYKSRQDNRDFTVYDYKVEFGEVGMDTSIALSSAISRDATEAIPVNFRVFNTTLNKQIDFAFENRDASGDSTKGLFTIGEGGRTRTDRIIFMEEISDTLITTWKLGLTIQQADSMRRNPQAGDVLTIGTTKPFLSEDVYTFTVNAETTDNTLAKADMDKIRVVPNPYIVTNSWEIPNPYATGRGPRQLHFTHLPQKCTIRIFDVLGQLVATLNHESSASDGTAVWNMLSKDQLEIGYGVYVYQIDAEGIGEKIGKFAVIK